MRLSLLGEAKFEKLGAGNRLGLTLGQSASEPITVKPGGEKLEPWEAPYQIAGSNKWRSWCKMCGEPVRVHRDMVFDALCRDCKSLSGRPKGRIKVSGKGGIWRSRGMASKVTRDVDDIGNTFGDVSPGTSKR